jgi:hypothetical protein
MIINLLGELENCQVLFGVPGGFLVGFGEVDGGGDGVVFDVGHDNVMSDLFGGFDRSVGNGGIKLDT